MQTLSIRSTISATASLFSPAMDEQILQHLPLARSMAQRMSARCPAHVERQDLLNAATCGVIEAAQAFDPARGVSFASFAQARVRGAMLDALRKMDWTPRSVLRKRRMLADLMSKVEARLGRPAEDEELAAELDLPLGDYQRLLDDIRGVRIDSIGIGDEDEGALTFEHLEDAATPRPDELAQRGQSIEALGGAIDQLPEKERLVLTLYFYEELTLKEIGAILELTEGRISQLKTSALCRLRGKLHAHA
jgi:RNA polymerase sigma factor FliA